MPEVLNHQQLTAIAGEFGTPVYVYHAERIAEQYNKLQNAFKTCNARFYVNFTVSISQNNQMFGRYSKGFVVVFDKFLSMKYGILPRGSCCEVGCAYNNKHCQQTYLKCSHVVAVIFDFLIDVH